MNSDTHQAPPPQRRRGARPIVPIKLLKEPERYQAERQAYLWGDNPEALEKPNISDAPDDSLIPDIPTIHGRSDQHQDGANGVSTFPTQQLPDTPYPDGIDPYEQLDKRLGLDVSRMNTIHLMQYSGLLQVVERQPGSPTRSQSLRSAEYERILTAETLLLPAIAQPSITSDTRKELPAWRVFLNLPAVRVTIGLLIGVAMLLLVSRFVDIPKTIKVLQQNLTTPQGILSAIAASLSFLTAFSIRGTRWRLFLKPISKITPIKAVCIYWIGVFINVLLPVQGGELAKSLLLKRVTGTPISQSLPTVAMDKSLDLMPALFIMAVVPFIPGIHMSITLWLILGLVSSILIGVIFTIALTAWNRELATRFIKMMIRILPANLGGKIEGFAMGFVDSLLVGASRPRTFIPAVLLTCAAICCDGLFAMFAFWTVGVPINFGQAIFGYTVFNMFTILPTPPGQVGSNEIIGPLVFSGLLGFDKTGVLAMFVFSHPLTALLMATTGMISLSTLGLKLSSALKPQGA